MNKTMISIALGAASIIGTAWAQSGETWWYCTNVSGATASVSQIFRGDVLNPSEYQIVQDEIVMGWQQLLADRGVVVGTALCTSTGTEAQATTSRSDFIQANNAAVLD